MQVSHLSFVWVVLLLLGYSSAATAQTVIIDEGFDDGDFTDNPPWSGDSADFNILKESSNYLLQLDGNDQETDISAITTTSSAAYGEWEALIRVDNKPTSGNFARFYLLADTANIKESVTGYYL
ncbi:MAG TPA: hypothetical protein VK074_01795, partial [Fodinibius sp.]|nr:hypothetical protein [Fodinibius sp.]